MSHPQNQREPDLRDLGFEVRELTGLVERLTDQVEKNTAQSRENHEALIVIKTRAGIVWACFSLAGGAISAVVLKLIFKV